MMTREGIKRNMRFQVCDVERPLGSVSSICKAGNSVVFNPPDDPRGSYIEHQGSGGRMYLESKDGAFVFNTKVAPRNKQAYPFGGRGRWLGPGTPTPGSHAGSFLFVLGLLRMMMMMSMPHVYVIKIIGI